MRHPQALGMRLQNKAEAGVAWASRSIRCSWNRIPMYPCIFSEGIQPSKSTWARNGFDPKSNSPSTYTVTSSPSSRPRGSGVTLHGVPCTRLLVFYNSCFPKPLKVLLAIILSVSRYPWTYHAINPAANVVFTAFAKIHQHQHHQERNKHQYQTRTLSSTPDRLQQPIA